MIWVVFFSEAKEGELACLLQKHKLKFDFRKYFRMEGVSFLKRLEILKLFLVLQKGIVGCQKVGSNLLV
jgi:hypothetical protein